MATAFNKSHLGQGRLVDLKMAPDMLRGNGLRGIGRHRSIWYVGVAEPPPSRPVGGVHYPRTLQEFDAWFSSETRCLEYLQRLRCPQGFDCPAADTLG